MTNIYFSVSISHLKGGDIVWTCVKDRIINAKEQYEAIGLHGLDYKLFEGEECGGTRKLLDGYPYLKHLIQLCPGGCMKQIKK